MNTAIDRLESKLETLEQRAGHVGRLIEALGDPSEWEYTGEVYDAGMNGSYCACGHPIRWCFSIHNPRTDDHKIVGSTCIDHFSSINPATGERLLAAREALEKQIKESQAKAKRAAADDANAELWGQYALLRDQAKEIHAGNRENGRRSSRSLWLFVEGWHETYRVNTQPQYTRAGDLKRWLNDAIKRVKEAIESDKQAAPPPAPVDTAPSPIPSLATHNMTVTVNGLPQGHRTFRISTVQGGNLEGKRIIALLAGPDNENDYQGFGFVRDDGKIKVWNRHKGTDFEYFADLFNRPGYHYRQGLDYMPEGRCIRCNHKLTHPDSIISGIGPECAKKE